MAPPRPEGKRGLYFLAGGWLFIVVVHGLALFSARFLPPEGAPYPSTLTLLSIDMLLCSLAALAIVRGTFLVAGGWSLSATSRFLAAVGLSILQILAGALFWVGCIACLARYS